MYRVDLPLDAVMKMGIWNKKVRHLVFTSRSHTEHHCNCLKIPKTVMDLLFSIRVFDQGQLAPKTASRRAPRVRRGTAWPRRVRNCTKILVNSLCILLNLVPVLSSTCTTFTTCTCTCIQVLHVDLLLLLESTWKVVLESTWTAGRSTFTTSIVRVPVYKYRYYMYIYYFK